MARLATAPKSLKMNSSMGLRRCQSQQTFVSTVGHVPALYIQSALLSASFPILRTRVSASSRSLKSQNIIKASIAGNISATTSLKVGQLLVKNVRVTIRSALENLARVKQPTTPSPVASRHIPGMTQRWIGVALRLTVTSVAPRNVVPSAAQAAAA